MFVPSSTCKPSSTFLPSFIPILVSSLDDDDIENENIPLLAHLPLDESIEHELASVPSLPRWVRSTQETGSDLVNDPTYHH
jgi:hypothetical protein